MKQLLYTFALFLIIAPCTYGQQSPRETLDFNWDWKFSKGSHPEAKQAAFDDETWQKVRLPHDWSLHTGYQKENTAASTGFVEGGIGWYRKTFTVPKRDQTKVLTVEFDGIFCNSEVYLNGKKLGFRPNGYASFAYTLNEYLNFGAKNVLSVKVDHSNYADTRWYTGSGIYRNVRLVKTSKVHIPQWGVRITTPTASAKEATITIQTKVQGADKNCTLEISIVDANNTVAYTGLAQSITTDGELIQDVKISDPLLWGISSPHLYTAKLALKYKGQLVDAVEQVFGIRTFHFDSRKGFFLNGENLKIKGVNIHHDAGAVGTAANKGIWEYRVKKLKSIGVNAIRMAHNPHSPELMDVCDEMGMLVMNEFFDEWQHPKGKSVDYLGDNAAGADIATGYSDVFFDWAETDLKDLIRRDFNHPSVILWSIGNEIEWTFPYYSETYKEVEGDIKEYKDAPTYDTARIKPIFDRITGGVDSCAIVAHQLSKWVKEEDTTRPIICGSVRPTIAFASGYADAVDVLGLNYRAIDYDAAHAAFPDKPLLGSENWVAYSEWKACLERDFIPGIFVWTGFAYRGEAGPWPRKGLNISLFDFAGFKTPRGHFFECLWKDTPKVYMVTTPASESEFSYSAQEGWKFDMQLTPAPVWNKLRLWEWYKVNEFWDYKTNENIIVQAYTNCEEAELFLNGKSVGKQALSDFANDDHIIKWQVPFSKGELKVVGYNQGKKADEYSLSTAGDLAKIKVTSNKNSLTADGNDVAHLNIELLDSKGSLLANKDEDVLFEVTGAAKLLAVDNGWEYNVQDHLADHVLSHNGKVLGIVQAGRKTGEVKIVLRSGNVSSAPLIIPVQ